MAHRLHMLSVALAAFAAQAALNVELAALDTPVIIPVQENAQKWSPELFKSLCFGHWASGIDWVWIKSLTDSSVTHVAPGTHAAVFYDLDLITDLDPAYYEIYPSGANLLAVIRNDGDGAKDLLLKGREFMRHGLASYPEEFQLGQWRNRWEIPLLLAYVYLFELNDMPHAAEAFTEASAQKGSPPYLQRLVERLQRPGGQYQVGIRLLNFLIESHEEGSALRRQLERKRESLLIGQYLFELNASFSDFRARQRKRASASEPSEAFGAFLKKSGNSLRDPFGGTLSLSPSGKITSSIPHEKVFGLD